MSLLQIHDPSGKPVPIGIDLGTTQSLVAYVTTMGEPEVVRDCDNEALVPSVVHYPTEGAPIVGRRALALAGAFPKDTVVSVKRFMGRDAQSVAAHDLYRFDLSSSAVPRFVVPQATPSAVEVSAEILRELKQLAEDEVGMVGPCVITVPAYFDDAQRQATKDAARLAGLSVLRLLNEPTAAALAYGVQKQVNGLYAVYDLGGGTFDITILELQDSVFHVRAVGGDSALGGDDIDRALAAHFLVGARNPDRHELMSARALKHALTDHASAEVVTNNGDCWRADRELLQRISAPLLARTKKACERVLRDAETVAAELAGVILVGGSTRTYGVAAFVGDIFGKTPMCDLDPELVVAMGAAIQADLLCDDKRSDDVLLLDVLPLSLGIKAMGGVVERILPRNTPIPCQKTQTFTTYADNQTGFEIEVVQGERELAADNRELAKFVLKGIPAMAAGLPRLDVTFQVNADGILKVHAKERVSGIAQEVEVVPAQGLSEKEIEAMLDVAYQKGASDMQARKLAEEKIETARVIAATEKALREDGDLLSADERTDIDAALQAARSASGQSDGSALEQARKRLEQATHAFAGRRMDRSMQSALRGQGVVTMETQTAAAKGIERAHDSIVPDR